MAKFPLVLTVSGLLLLIVVLLFGWVIFPRILHDQIAKNLKLVNGSEIWDAWVDVPVTVYMKVYIFNVTNPSEVEKGGKPRLQDVGPYVYSQKRKKVDVSIMDDGDMVQYRQRTWYFFEPNLSHGSEDDILTVLNVPFVMVASKLRDIPYFLLPMASLYLGQFQESLFIQKPIRELLFEGYYQPLLSDLQELTGRKILTNNKFGLYYPKNGSDDGVYEILTGLKNPDQLGEIVTWNNMSRLSWWTKSPEDFCNMINGTDGSFLPPLLTKNSLLRIFSPEVCRSVYLAYEKDIDFMGIPGFRFTPPKEMSEDPRVREDNLCFCPEPGDDMENCPKGGLFLLSPCQEGAPISLSSPHFYQGAQEYVNQCIGLSPSKELHDTYFDVEPTSGLIMKAQKRMQMNVELKKVDYVGALENVPEMWFPVLWAEEAVEIDEEMATAIKSSMVTPLKVVNLIIWALIAISCGLIATGGACCVWTSRRRYEAVATK